MIKYITPVRPAAASGMVGEVFQQIKGDFGAVVAPFSVHSISPRLLAAVWGACRESQLAGTVPREIKEAVAVAVSKLNNCPFCVDAHSIMLGAMQAHCVAHALNHNRPDQLPERTRAIVEWAASTGQLRSESLPLPFSAEEAPEIIGTTLFYHYMNRIAIILLNDTPLPSSRRWLKGALSRIASWYFSIAARRVKVPGASLALLPHAELPQDLAWAAANERLAGAWARFAHEVERLGQAALPAETMKFASEVIQKWEGGELRISRGAVEEAIQRLRPDERSCGRLVLLTALAPHDVDEKIIRDFADPASEPEKLLGALSWASFSAARRIGSWLHVGGC